MESYTIIIHAESAAFDDDAGPEIARILRQLAADIDNGGPQPQRIRDSNGGLCGEVIIF